MTIYTAYNDLIKLKAKEMGFKKYGKNAYFRVVNDMFQSFKLKVYQKTTCSYVFDIFPLCFGIKDETLRYGNGAYLAEDFYIPKSSQEMDITQYVGTSASDWYTRNDETIQRAASNVAALMHEHVFPFFERANHSSLAYDELKKMVAYQDFCFKEKCKIKHGIEIPKHFTKWRYGHVTSFLEMKNGYYDASLEFYRSEVKRYKQTIDSLSASQNREYSLAVFQKGLVERERILGWLESNDIDAINNLISENEQQSREYLSSIGWKFKDE